MKSGKVSPLVIDCLDASKAAQWSVEAPPPDLKERGFALERVDGRDALRISTGAFVPGKTTVRVLLPGNGAANGDVWAKGGANFLSFRCKSNKPAEMTVHLGHRGKSAGTYTAWFTARPGVWQSIALPVQKFGLKSFAKTAGIGFRVVSAEPGTEVYISDISVGGTAFSDETWNSQIFAASLNGEWHFATDAGSQGVEDKWFAGDFDDSKWQILRSGQPWQAQGVDYSGYAWYRQRLVVPKESAGVALTLTLAPITGDDDVWFNGVRVGGIHSAYEYANQTLRTYTVRPTLIRYGATNTIAIRIWGGNLGFVGPKSGLVAGPYKAEADPYRVLLREQGEKEQPAELFDLTDAQRGKPFEIILPYPAEMAEGGATAQCVLKDFYGKEIARFSAPLEAGPEGQARAVLKVDSSAAQTIYLRGRFVLDISVSDAKGNVLYSGLRDLDHLSFAKRDEQGLPALAETLEDTPYGKLKLVDEIDCSVPAAQEEHPYLQSGFDKAQTRNTPGSDVEVKVSEILGKKARESEYGWFAYRVGRGKLEPRKNYLLRIEYPEDKPRYCPIEIQAGQNFFDVGWENGISPDDPYAPWPLSHGWQWYDAIVSLDDETTGTGGAGSASAQNGFWVYFLNKIKPRSFFSMYEGGPAIARIKLYEIDPEKNAPMVRRPEGLPQRVLMFDWERQPEQEPADIVRYARLMGYNAVSPVIMKWHSMNYGEPLKGYDSANIDDRGFWVRDRYVAEQRDADGNVVNTSSTDAAPVRQAVPGKPTVHAKYLEATKRYGMGYVPRFEYGGSTELPLEARAIGGDGAPAKPNRFHTWCADLLHPATMQDLTKLMDSLIKPYAKDNPQLTGALWRIRCDRMPVSYSRADLDLFAKETGVSLPAGSDKDLAAWASTGAGRAQYDDWWSKKRAEFHGKLAELLRSYRPDMKLYYFNWDGDKFSLVQPSLTSWAFLGQVVNAPGGDGRAVYEKDREGRRNLAAKDYIEVLRSGDSIYGKGLPKRIDRIDYALRPELYRDIKGVELLAPANQPSFADNPEYLNYFKTAEGLAVSNPLIYDEVAARTINPKYEGNMITPGGAPFSMAYELLSYFHGDARTLTYTVYTYGRGFADAHRRFAQAFLALPAIEGTEIEETDPNVKIRSYPTDKGTYVGVAHKGYEGKKLAVTVPWSKGEAVVKNLVTGEAMTASLRDGKVQFDLASGPMELNAFLIQ